MAFVLSSRLMISQDRHEIYLTVAEYDQEYIRYLNNEQPARDEISLMKMNEFRPWVVQDRYEMQSLGEIILAVAMQDGELLLGP